MKMYRNVGSMDKEDINVGTGMVGAACGDVMKLQIKVDDNNIITDVVLRLMVVVVQLHFHLVY